MNRWAWQAPGGVALAMADSRLSFTATPCPMLTGDLRNKVDQVWNAFWSGGIANPMEVIEQITYLLF